MKTKRRKNVVILSGADGPTSIFLAGKSRKLPLIEWFKDWQNQRKQEKIKKIITVDPHSMEEVVRYAKAKYHAVELTSDARNFMEERRSHKEGLVLLKRPDLLERLQKVQKPKEYNDETIARMEQQIEIRSQQIAALPEDELPMDFHLYEIRKGNEEIEMAVDFYWNVLTISHQGDQKTWKQGDKIIKDLYRYYGVTRKDIEEKSDRYKELVAVLGE
nr:hypothetical protein [uncultured Sellimonas sp.]